MSPSYRTIQPATGECLQEFASATGTEIEGVLSRSHSAARTQRGVPPEKRAEILLRLASELRGKKDMLARLITLEMGKILRESEQEVERCADACGSLAAHGMSWLESRTVAVERGEARISYAPLGPILAIMPWNFPFWQVFRFAAPAFLAGNTVILKHAPNTPQCAVAITKLWLEAGAEPGCFENLFLTNDQAGAVIADPRIRGVSLTGSVAAGKAVAAAAGANLKKCVLELGGSDPFIVLSDVNVERAVDAAATYRFMNNGQSCISPKRFVVHESVYNRFRDGLVEKARARKVGDPFLSGTDQGPLARGDLRDALVGQMTRATAGGARALTGGKGLDGAGYYFEPTVVECEDKENTLRSEEVFGPVAVLVRFAEEVEAIAIANETAFGLGASIWTNDRARAERMVSKIEAGCIFVNEGVRSEPLLPFGGTKNSGIGKELGPEGIRELMLSRTERFFSGE